MIWQPIECTAMYNNLNICIYKIQNTHLKVDIATTAHVNWKNIQAI